MSQNRRELSDIDLIDLVQGGNATAFLGIIERFRSRIYAHIYGMVRNREVANNLTEQTFVKAFRNIGGFRREASFTTWLYRIARNVTIDWIREHRRTRTDALNEQATQMSETETRQPMTEALQRLPEEQRAIVNLRDTEGLSYREIAEIMCLPEGIVMSRLFYARKKLNKLLDPK